MNTNHEDLCKSVNKNEDISYQSTLQDAWTGPSPRRKAEEAPKKAKSVQQTRDCIVGIGVLCV